MASVVLTGDTSGAGTITVPAVAGAFTATIGSATGTHYPFTAGTAVASTSGTSIDFTSIPSWVKRITVSFSAVSTNGTSNIQIQLGDAGGIETTGYVGAVAVVDGSSPTYGASTLSAGVLINTINAAAYTFQGQVVFANISGNNWSFSGVVGMTGLNRVGLPGGYKTLSDTLTQLRITTVNGTDTFDAGSINILYE